jgi:hypothetical protein
MQIEHNDGSVANTQLLNAVHTNARVAYEQFCKKHRLLHKKVKLATLMQNNMHQAEYLNIFYQLIIKHFNNNPKLVEDEEYITFISYFHNHMVNVSCYENYSHSHNGTKITKNGKEARTASFNYCVDELIPQIQKKLRPLL